MKHLIRLLTLAKRDTRGVTALEYGLIAAVIGGVVITGATAVGGGLDTVFTVISDALNSAST